MNINRIENKLRIRKRKRNWNQFFKRFNTPTNEVSLLLDDPIERGTKKNPASVNEEDTCEQNVGKSCSRNKITHDNSTNFTENLTTCLEDINLQTTNFVVVQECKVKLSNILNNKEWVSCVSKREVNLNEMIVTPDKPRKNTILNSKNTMKKKRKHDSAKNLSFEEIDPRDEVKGFQESRSVESLGLTQNDVKDTFAESYNTFSVSKKVKSSSKINNNRECVKNVNAPKSNQTPVKVGSMEEYLQYTNQYGISEADSEAIIARIKLMNRCTKNNYKKARLVLRFLKHQGQQNTDDYASIRQIFNDQLKIMKENFSRLHISLYDHYLDWLYDKCRKF